MPPKGWKKHPDGYKPMNAAGAAPKAETTYTIDDLLMPRSLIVKLAKTALTNDAPLPKDGVTALMRATTVFISYIAATASRISQDAGRKILSLSDVLSALEEQRFGDMVALVQESTEAMQAEQKKQRSKKQDEFYVQDDEIDGEPAEDASKKPRLDGTK